MKNFLIRLSILLKIFLFLVDFSLAYEVVVSGYVLEKIAKEILPDQKIILLQTSKVEFHSYEPTPSQWEYIKKADLLMIVGTESWAKKVFSLRKSKPTLILSQNQTYLPDPHLWFNFEALENLVRNLVWYFKDKEPYKVSLYEQRATLFLKKLQKVKKNYEILKECPIKKIYLLGHPVFYYLLRDLGIQEETLFKGHLHEGEASLKTLSRIINQLKKDRIRIIYFTDSQMDRLKYFFESQGIEVLKVYSGDTPWEGDFIDLLDKNLEKFKIGLQCK